MAAAVNKRKLLLAIVIAAAVAVLLIYSKVSWQDPTLFQVIEEDELEEIVTEQSETTLSSSKNLTTSVRNDMTTSLPEVPTRGVEIPGQREAGFSESNLAEIEDEFMKKMRLRMEERRDQVKKVCIEQGWKGDKAALSADVMYLKNYNILFCQNPKTGITNWKKLFVALDPINWKKEKGPVDFAFLVHGTAKYHLLQSTDVLKMTVVREPFERLLSAFRNRLDDNPKHFAVMDYKQLSKDIHKTYGNASDGEYATFNEFVSYLVNKSDIGDVNQHWRSFQHLCQPCAVDYDIIGHQETIEEDSTYFLRLIGALGNVKLRGGYHNHTDDELMRKYYGLVKPKEKLDKLYELLEHDFMLFNYSRPF